MSSVLFIDTVDTVDMGMIRKVIYGVGIVSGLSYFSSGEQQSAFPELSDSVRAIRDVADDVSGFCSRRPQACEIGSVTLQATGERIGDGLVGLARGLKSARNSNSNAATALAGASDHPDSENDRAGGNRALERIGLPVPAPRPL